jgi:hypothetical protein
MANTIAKAHGLDSTRTKSTQRLGSQSATGEANIWRTFSKIHINKDGSGIFQLKRDDNVIYIYKWGPEIAKDD